MASQCTLLKPTLVAHVLAGETIPTFMLAFRDLLFICLKTIALIIVFGNL